MFQSFLCYPDPMASSEAEISRLVQSHKRLLLEGHRVDTKSEAGFNAAALFLENLDAAARALRLEAASRSYRSSFTINYRALFPNESRNYRVDILEASIEQNAVIWVNGDKFEFSAEAMRCAQTLQKCWEDLGVTLERWNAVTEQATIVSKPSRKELQTVLVGIDVAWANFENKYINELIHIEDQARRLIVQAVESEKCFQKLEAENCFKAHQLQALVELPGYKRELKHLVGCIARLNSVANCRRKGRDDLSADILLDAVKTLARCDEAERSGENTELLAAARILSKDVVDAFLAARKYFQEIGKCLERVDPHLCNNAGLVAKLVDWEESWEVGARYVQNAPLLHGLCDLVAEVRLAQRIAPPLRTMCDECDVELFMVLPRIIWLRGLAKPGSQLGVFKSLLPHRFIESDEGNAQWSCDAELQEFVEMFNSMNALLMENWRSAARVSETAAWEILTKRVVLGSGDKSKEDAYSSLSPAVRVQAEAAVEDFMNKLEGWSMELQRHCAEDWNQLSAMIISCLSGSSSREVSQNPFQV
mmetsp:Transcript_71164/g.125793  ORF Transcript_71164/g.125793 Transcript_71164/m.125793 type:complete len:535 (+) Transcript_71164:103-1707(+)